MRGSRESDSASFGQKLSSQWGRGGLGWPPARLIGAFSDHKALCTLLVPSGRGTVHHGLSGLAYLLAHPPPVGSLQEAGSVHSPGILRSHNEGTVGRTEMRHQVGVGGDLRLTPAPELPPDPTPEGEREWEDCTGAQPPQVGHSCRDERGQRDGAQLSTFSSVQSHSRVRLFMTPWTAARQASLSITNSQSLLKLMSIEPVMPSNHLILCHPLLLPPSIFPSIRIFSNESALHIRRPKYWNFSFSIRPSDEYSGLISFRMDWLDLLAVQGTLKSLLQHHSSKASILWCSAFFMVQLSHP